ncbi:conserved Plasmodium membrane protein, unknown function [Plasmodium sp. DRC-Itaito]|nr:conserved Plasmodium membrane protein, unknown function [Plasmodium sp. DRC-Itaito]
MTKIHKFMKMIHKVKRNYLSIHIIHFIMNIIVLNYMVIYIFFLNKYHNDSKRNILDENENYYFHVEGNNIEERLRYTLIIIYIFFCLTLHLFICIGEYYNNNNNNNKRLCKNLSNKDNIYNVYYENKINNDKKNKENYKFYENKNPLGNKKNNEYMNKNYKQLRDKKRNDDIYISLNYIFLYVLLFLIGLSNYHIKEFFFYFYCILIICEINTPIIIFMNLIKIINKYYKKKYLFKDYNTINNIKKKDLYIFFCYFVLLRYLKKFHIYEKFKISQSENESEKKKKKKKKKNLISTFYEKENKIEGLFCLFNYMKNNKITYYYTYVYKNTIHLFLKKKQINKFCKIIYSFFIKKGGIIYSRITTLLKHLLIILRHQTVDEKGTDHSKKKIYITHDASEIENTNTTITNNVGKEIKKKKQEIDKYYNCLINKNICKEINTYSNVFKLEEKKIKASNKENYHNEKITQKEYDKVRKNVYKYKNYYEYFEKYKDEDTCNNLSFYENEILDNNNIYFLSKKKKKEFQVIEQGKNKLFFNKNMTSEEDNNIYKIEEEIKNNNIYIHSNNIHINKMSTDTSLYCYSSSSEQINKSQYHNTNHDKNDKSFFSYEKEEPIRYKKKTNVIKKKKIKIYCKHYHDVEHINKKVIIINNNNNNDSNDSNDSNDNYNHNNNHNNNFICLENNVKMFLSNFKRKMEIYKFLQMIYKVLLLLNIYLIFSIKGIIIYMNIYYFIFKSTHSLFSFHKCFLILLQCCYFCFFRLYVYEYRKLKR